MDSAHGKLLMATPSRESATMTWCGRFATEGASTDCLLPNAATALLQRPVRDDRNNPVSPATQVTEPLAPHAFQIPRKRESLPS